MNLKKTVTIAAAAGALAAISVPAMAFENEFHGMYKFKFIESNFDAGGTASDSQQSPTTLKKANKANNVLEQRARINYIAKASDDLKLVTAFELDARFGGTNNAKYGPTSAKDSLGNTIAVTGTQDGGVLDADGVSLETKWVYLDFNVAAANTNVKVGILPYKDAFKGVFLDADATTVYTTTKIGPASLGLGFLRAYDASGLQIAGKGNSTGNFVGDKTSDIYLLDGKFNVTKDIALGASYYFAAGNMPVQNGLSSETITAGALTSVAGQPGRNTQTLLHTLGLTADAKLGAAKISGFAAMQLGSFHDYGNTAAGTTAVTPVRKTFHGYAFNVAAAIPVGPGTIRTAALYTTGDDGKDGINNAWQPIKTYKATTTGTGGSGSAVSSYNEGGMMLLNRNTAQNNTNTDKYIVGTPDNSGKGLFLATVGFDATITPKLFANTNIGVAFANKNGIASTKNGSNYMGTEVNLETGYKLYDNLTAGVQAAYVFLGGAYHGTAADSGTLANFKKELSPENPYTARVVLSYAF